MSSTRQGDRRVYTEAKYDMDAFLDKAADWFDPSSKDLTPPKKEKQSSPKEELKLASPKPKAYTGPAKEVKQLYIYGAMKDRKKLKAVQLQKNSSSISRMHTTGSCSSCRRKSVSASILWTRIGASSSAPT